MGPNRAKVVTGGVTLVACGVLLSLLSEPERPTSTVLGPVVVNAVLPALVRSQRPDLEEERRASDRILLLAGSNGSVRVLSDGTILVGNEIVTVPDGYAERVGSMKDNLMSIRGVSSELSLLRDPEVVSVLSRAWGGMRRESVMAKGTAFVVNRVGILGRRGMEVELRLAPEPVQTAVGELHATRGSWAEAITAYERHRSVFLRGDTWTLFDKMLARDAARGYDEEKRRRHLDLTLDAVLPNTVESVVLDLASILSVDLDDLEPLAIIAMRQDTPLNRLTGAEDGAFVRGVAPLLLVRVESSGRAPTNRLQWNGTELFESGYVMDFRDLGSGLPSPDDPGAAARAPAGGRPGIVSPRGSR